MNEALTLGMLHAQELLLVSLIRALPPDTRRRIADEYQAQAELAETPHSAHPGSTRDREADEAFKAHVRKLSILLASLS
ncbi:hypothetical protein [Paraburkholderia kururiensis]|uniref:Uncharacterized protein n=1 Tax=Paraburkholderia kururiensis TaxID=984307 RepID=A0ABZ0WPN6_9BURK|nr:hypothetical protein [Paraburkholderia kururiensis]WQD79344.1 hypothetical protein U0042_06480 [Paraburkholderia kururiensis]